MAHLPEVRDPGDNQGMGGNAGWGLAMRRRQVALVAGATVSFGVALALAVVAVALVVALWREYGPLWTDPAIYLILTVPLLPALLGIWLLRRAGQR
jgi:hypothetical protein